MSHQTHTFHSLCSVQYQLEQIAIERSASTSVASAHQQEQCISSNIASAASAHQQHQHFSSISYMHWKGYLPIYINQFRSYQPIYTTRHASDNTRHHQTCTRQCLIGWQWSCDDLIIYRAVQLIQIFLADGRAVEHVPRGPRGPKKGHCETICAENNPTICAENNPNQNVRQERRICDKRRNKQAGWEL